MARGGTVLLLGSGPNAVDCLDWPGDRFDAIVALNNAWRVRPDWSHLVYPDDFPIDRHPPVVTRDQKIIRSDIYVPANNRFGGVAYAGGTMAFSAGYWVLAALEPRVIAVLGCDMVYAATGDTHFYGTGEADPLRLDPTLQSLEAKSNRFMALAAGQGTALVNLSGDASRLTFPRSTLNQMADAAPVPPDPERFARALTLEQQAAIFAESGRYWRELGPDAWAILAEIDRAWEAVYPLPDASARSGQPARTV